MNFTKFLMQWLSKRLKKYVVTAGLVCLNALHEDFFSSGFSNEALMLINLA